ncbi:uncharacterized protein LOC133821792 isoform X2 [Humulus lupulus]|uniref:uncharacterized protein LOC133821792 isoform X2 n=1 Tax=Humulus lupulus TaxID=3486 RepID=UPI002B402379|nr:uncharacterized protein LOC133821792 isoform X2 [Humulus lupulus]
MERVRGCCFLIVCVVLVFFASSIIGEKESGCSGSGSCSSDEYETKPTTESSTEGVTATSKLDKLKTLLKTAQTHLFPPNLEGGEEIGGGEKGAVGKSFDQGVETVEGSAKTAAKIAGETVTKAKDTVQHTFSKDDSYDDQQAEL